MDRLRLLELAFHGADKTATIQFGDGLTVIQGASDTGKTFTLEAIDFMLGEEGIEPIPELDAYETIELRLLRSDGSVLLLTRHTAKHSAFSVREIDLLGKSTTARIVTWKHYGKNENNISSILLQSIGISNKKIAKNIYGEHANLSFRDLAHLFLVDEISVLEKGSPILRGNAFAEQRDKSAFRFIISGRDDSELVSIDRAANQRAKRDVQIELLTSLISDINVQLEREHPQIEDYLDQLSLLDQNWALVESTYAAIGLDVATIIDRKRAALISLEGTTARISDVQLGIQRFRALDFMYQSNIRRLESLEEAGFLLGLSAEHDCPLCGALPEHQQHHDVGVAVKATQEAAQIEISKIEGHRKELSGALQALEQESRELEVELRSAELRVREAASALSNATPQRELLHSDISQIQSIRTRIAAGLSLVEQRGRLEQQRIDHENQSFAEVSFSSRPELRPAARDILPVCMRIETLLQQWDFPGVGRVDFDEENWDFRIGGRLRKAHGKGVRAILHAAFSIALMQHCFDKDLPHPGFVVLDTPLRAYSPPKADEAVDADDEAIAKSPLRDLFFDYLRGLEPTAQVIVLENSGIPFKLETGDRLIEFTGNPDIPRSGLL